MGDIFIILILGFWGYFIYSIIKLFIEGRKVRREAEENFERHRQQIMDEYYKILFQQLKNAQQANKYSKWFQLDQHSRDKITKIKALADRGEAGEKTAAQLKYQNLLQKNNLQPADVPV